MRNKQNAILQDSGMERAVMAGIATYGSDCFFEVEDIINVKDLYWKYNQELFAIFSHMVHKEDTKTFDLPSIQATARILGYASFAAGGKHTEYLTSIIDETGLSRDNVQAMVIAIYKLSLARQGYLAVTKIQKTLTSITGAEGVDEIISAIEEPIFEFTGNTVSQTAGVVSLGDSFQHVMQSLATTPQDIVGLPTGFTKWDIAIGGGLRPATVNVIGARPKIGKCHGSFSTVVLTNLGILMPYEMYCAKSTNFQQALPQLCSSDLRLLNSNGDEKQPEYWWNNGFVDVIKIQTKYGNTLSATPNHPVQILDTDGKIKWKNTEDLKSKDYLVCRRGDRYWGSATIDINDAYVIGLLVGDGCINDTIVELASINGHCREQFRTFIGRCGGDIGTENKFHIRCNRVKIAKKILSLGFYDENNRKIFPTTIRTCKEEIVCRALRGYFDADGCVEKRGVTATTNSQKLAIQLKAMLLNLGILSKTRIRHIVPPGHTKPNVYWEIAIQNVESAIIFRDLIGFGIERKQKLLNSFCEKPSSTKNDVIPNLKVPLLALKRAIQKHRGFFLPGRRVNMRDNVNRWIRGTRKARRDVVQKLLNQLSIYDYLPEYQEIKTIIDPHLLFDPIHSLLSDKEWTSDFYIPDGHSFITNGMVSHNSFFCINVAKNMAENGIPVLYLDTELTSDTQLHRLASLVSGVELNHVETGQFVKNQHESDALWESQANIKKLDIDHFSVAGLTPQAIMSIARRWLSKTVGFTDSGCAKPCLIIYDYLKLMDDGGLKGNVQEYQLLGFLITALHNFAVKYKLPVLATVQLNRDGVEREGAEVVSGSDRIVWLCSNFTILKKKTQTELNEDPPSNGTKKLVVTDTRYGPGMESGEYINIVNELEIGKLAEGQTFSMVTQSSMMG